MTSVLQRMASATPQRAARLSKDQFEAGIYLANLYDKAGFNRVGVHELKTYVDYSFDKRRTDDHIVRRFSALSELRRARFLLGKQGYDLLIRVCVDDDRVRGKFENEFLKQCLTLIYQEMVLPNTGSA